MKAVKPSIFDKAVESPLDNHLELLEHASI